MARGVAKNHDERREALRKGAARYFAAHGFDRASMTGTAQACGVSKALIYHYWDSKEALLFDILEAHLSALVDVVAQAKGEGLKGLIRVILLAYADADVEHKLQLDALKVLPAERQAPLVAMQRELVAMMAEELRQEAGDVSEVTLRELTMTVFGILNWYYMWHRPGKGLSRAEYADLAAKFVLGGLRAI